MKSSFFHRLISAVVDVSFVIIMALAFAKILVSPLLSPITHINDHISHYKDLSKEFENLQDQYGLYIYDEKEQRIENKEVTEEQKQSFLNDTRVQEIKEEVLPLQDEIRKDTLIEMATSFYVSALFCYLLVPLAFRKKKATIGKKIFHLVQVDKEGNLLSTQRYEWKNFLIFFFHYILGTLTFGVLLLVEAILIVSRKDRASLVDMLSKSETCYDSDYLEESLETDEKRQEAINTQTQKKKLK